MNKHIIGIDLGTTNSCVGIWRNNNFELIFDKSGSPTIPSIVAFTNKFIHDKSKFIGFDAKNQMELNPENTFYEIKRIIGRSFSDPYITELINSGILSYNLIPNDNSHILIESTLSTHKTFTPEEISAFILSYLKQLAQNYLNDTITDCVITVPANFTDLQRQATIDSATIAGLNCLRIINEPTAAALAYGFYDSTLLSNKDINILVYDFGGGTLDVSIVNICDGLFDVIASSGFSHFGGSDFDARIMSFCLLKFNQKNNIKITEHDISKLNIQKLKSYSENAKKLLSSNFKTIISIHNFYNNIDLHITLTQDMLTELFNDLLFKCIEPISDILQKTNLSISQLDDIILIGGMTKFPIIKTSLQQYFQRDFHSTIDPDFTVAMGAAIQGYLIYNQINEINNTIFSNNITLLDKTSLSIGLEINNGIMDIVIPFGSNIPISVKKYYTSDTDFIEDIIIKIYEGERKLTKDNYLLGTIHLTELPKQLKGILKIAITFNIDNNGLITIIAEEESNHNKKDLIITYNKNRLSPSEIDTLIKDCFTYELQDELNTKRQLLHSNILSLCNTILNNLNYNTLLNLSTEYILITQNDINNIINKLNNTFYFDISITELENFENIIKTKYDNLTKILVSDSIQSANSVSNEKNIEPSIYDNEDLINYKNTLIELCNSLNSALISYTLPVFDILKDYINDTLLWFNITDSTNPLDYKYKIDDINNLSTKLFEQNKQLFSKSNFQILEDKCLNFLLMYDEKIITDIDFINFVNSLLEQLYSDKLTNENEISNLIHQLENKFNLLNIHYTINDISFINSSISSGTSIFDILNDKQNDILKNL